MPWQQYVADIALEVDPDTGLLVYREVILPVPRQSGKTTLLLATMVHRANGFKTRQRILYSAQKRIMARAKWEDEHVRVLEDSSFRGMFSVRKQIGQEAIRWSNGSLHGITSATETAGHGETLDLGVIDEAFAQTDSRIEQAFKPAMITRPSPQLWIPSTAGTAKSVYFRGKVTNGRERAQLGLTSDVAYIEWSAPNDADPADPATWWACMPALGHTVTEAAVRADYNSMDLAEFRRAYLNQWQDEFPDPWLVIDEADWTRQLDPTSAIVGPLVLAIDMTPERSYTSIAACGYRADGSVHVELADHRPGSGWVLERVRELQRRHPVTAVVIDPAGPAGTLIESFENEDSRKHIEVTQPTVREYVQACGWLYDAVRDGTVWHIGQPDLTSALSGAAKRDLGDAWAWARKGLSIDVSPAVAFTLAAWGLRTVPNEQYDPLDSVR
jgi:phage terminase large subunit-like protein